MKHLTHTDLSYLWSLSNSIMGEITKGIEKSNKNDHTGGHIDSSYLREKLSKIEDVLK